MKTLHNRGFLAMIGCLLIGSTSCNRTSEFYKTDHIYINHSEHPLRITHYFHDHKSEVTIQINQSIRQTGYTPYVDRDHIIYSDSVRITFDEAKQVTYTKAMTSTYTPHQTRDQNILNLANYTFIELNESHGQFRYVIGEELFNQAQPITQ